MRVPPLAFFITKYFGSGVIIATAFIHVSSLITCFEQSLDIYLILIQYSYWHLPRALSVRHV
jgi:zinc transporter 1/2/3